MKIDADEDGMTNTRKKYVKKSCSSLQAGSKVIFQTTNSNHFVKTDADEGRTLSTNMLSEVVLLSRDQK